MGQSRVRHIEQRQLFSIEKEPSMNSQTSFWAETTGFAELFTDYRVYDLISKNSLIGIDLKNVVLKNGSYSEKLYQVTSRNILDRQCIGIGYGEKKLHCGIFGKEQFFIDNAYQLHLDFSKIHMENDLYVTERMFGEGIAYPLYLISQRFYQLLKKHKLAGGLTFSPVVDIS